MFAKLMPWKFLLRHTAHHLGFMNPVDLLARLRQFSQPSDVAEPIELLRAGVAFHARGLVNTKAIQTNLDWVWPFWVEKQFNPQDPSFIPRAFSFSHINLTHRNWTAVGRPDLAIYSVIDPRGLITPLLDGWSLDVWYRDSQGNMTFPSRLPTVQQSQHCDDELRVVTTLPMGERQLTITTWMARQQDNTPALRIAVQGEGLVDGQVFFAIRPYNPEGIQFVEQITLGDDKQRVTVNKAVDIHLSESARYWMTSHYALGDVHESVANLAQAKENQVACKAGMASAAIGFDAYQLEGETPLTLTVPLADEGKRLKTPTRSELTWASARQQTAQVQLPDRRIGQLFQQATQTLWLLSADDLVPGPYTYRRFWYRDASLMMSALTAAGLSERAEQALVRFPSRQKRDGYYQSQEGEWDANGQVLWAMAQFYKTSGQRLPDALLKSAAKAVRWFPKRREQAPSSRHHGLLPAGFSAEHFGPNDHYYWDTYWAIAGLEAIADVFRAHAQPENAQFAESEAAAFRQAMVASQAPFLEKETPALPASPYRRMDAGAIGTLVADYPLQLVAANEAGMNGTLEFLLNECLVDDAFFQDMIHSGQNAYLTLALAQALLRRDRPEDAHRLLQKVASLASPTGHWPEANHPQTGGGCMGDGQHGWAAAEWVMIIRNLFIREEGTQLWLGQGLIKSWQMPGTEVGFGPTATPFGRVSLTIYFTDEGAEADLSCEPFAGAPSLDAEFRLPGFQRQRAQQGRQSLTRLAEDTEETHQDAHINAH